MSIWLGVEHLASDARVMPRRAAPGAGYRSCCGHRAFSRHCRRSLIRRRDAGAKEATYDPPSPIHHKENPMTTATLPGDDSVVLERSGRVLAGAADFIVVAALGDRAPPRAAIVREVPDA
jgi:hypothetical protein